MPSPAASLFGYLNWTFAETYQLLYRTKGWLTGLGVNMAKYWLDWPLRFTSRKDRRLDAGQCADRRLAHRAQRSAACRCG
jgi:3-oxosteroid 1-dehydrogenase